ncbi:MAG: MFS transporter, partial [Clostridia bacterium]
IYPALMHETALRFNKKTAGNTIGLQMAAANLGILVIPVAFGFIAEKTSFEIMPYVAGVILLVLIVVSEKLNSLTKRQL